MNSEPQNGRPDSSPSVPVADTPRADAARHAVVEPSTPDSQPPLPTPHPNGANGHDGSPIENQSAELTAGASASPSEIQNQTPKPDNPERRSHSKIGRLPKTTRDKLNEMVRDGVPYPDIPAKLGDDANDITARNISSWQSGPHYQRWLLEQDWLEKLRDDQEPAFDLLTGFDASKFDEATLQLAITRLFLALRHIDSGDLNKMLGGNVQSFARLVSALARACRETTNIEKYRAALAKAVAPKCLDPNRDLTDEETQAIVRKMDEILGFCSPGDPKPESDKRRKPGSSASEPKASSVPVSDVLP
ncbi:MAG TPA: hypothetical protein VNZ64_09395 [Candidatus Acidoferrum sp.]|jgi:hypothetical protein|nr:hypothetical protein [Candidatus Acidoferrum sp.]